MDVGWEHIKNSAEPAIRLGSTTGLNRRGLLRSHAVWLATFLALRVSLCTAVLHCSKELLRRSVRKRGPRWLRGVVHFLCDVLLPTSFFGPLLGLTAAAVQLTGLGTPGQGLGQGLGLGLGWLRGGGRHLQRPSAAPMPPPLVAALPAVAAAASDAVAATVSATVAATVTPAVAATANWGTGK
ncbi:hypothetical protein VOLCADRAFT_93922 [Volvox carteri f. nagariensis]|uniref:Uncharacterized protein n=1 Tax=Volvox carteri f. nagariensis TaxID=3068 RepID=D8U3F4_VOLCA|nr:uncharacterized protein VOLCADRAFT_93922 [Volvox carteri f. nagariensis]EFJ45744.1 hypothetical protein VOLCADRAFT_93922 [Volvox carteri f. nagariensis]|eukprot:XP_002953145.1 hypothetical protein VOLCADRAFT_93922 [Volvox carteri f. nagariensis]